MEQKDCILLVPDVRTITRPFSECFDVKVKAQTGFKILYTCNCKINDCIASHQAKIVYQKIKDVKLKGGTF